MIVYIAGSWVDFDKGHQNHIMKHIEKIEDLDTVVIMILLFKELFNPHF